MFVFVVSVFIACVGSWIVGIKLNNSNNYFVETTLINELSFDSEYVKDITSSLPDIFLQKFNVHFDTRRCDKKTVLRGIFYVTSVLPSKNSFSVRETHL